MARQDARKKFIELAEKRVSRTLKDIQLIGNLSNKSNYRYSDSDVRKISKALNEALEEMKARFEQQLGRGTKKFKLEE